MRLTRLILAHLRLCACHALVDSLRLRAGHALVHRLRLRAGHALDSLMRACGGRWCPTMRSGIETGTGVCLLVVTAPWILRLIWRRAFPVSGPRSIHLRILSWLLILLACA
jgi:hypothetical protein